MGGALGSAVTGCDVVNGGGEASDNGTAKVIRLEGESDALGSALSGSTSPFALAEGSLTSGAVIPFCVPDGGTTVSATVLPRTTLRFGSGGASASTREIEDST